MLKFALILFFLCFQVFAEVSIEREFFGDTNIVSREYFFKGGVLFQSKGYSKAGENTSWYAWKKRDERRWLREKLNIESGATEEKVELLLEEGVRPEEASLNNSFVAKRWNFSKNPKKKPTTIEVFKYGHKFPVEKIILDENENERTTLKFFYHPKADRAYKFEEVERGEVIRSFEMYEDFNPEKTWQNSSLTSDEIEKRRRNLERNDKFLVAIIDGGFDYNHLALAHHWYMNPKDPQDGIDNDGNGWVDDTLGWERERGIGLPTESTTKIQDNWRPFSHGTHVAHIATRDLWGVGLIGFAGDYTKASYLKKISQFIKEHKVRVVNMSIGLPHDMRNNMGLREANKELKKIIASHPETLFVVASGNSTPGVNIDEYRNRQYPANIKGDNIIKVGSLNSNSMRENFLDSYLMADFSNYGLEFVDILAPGENVSAASLGGGEISHSGTSMATPYMVNEIIRLWQEYPSFSAKEIKKIFMDSAYELPSLPEVKTRGMVYREGARQLAKERFLVKRWERAKSLTQVKNGPNCWNSSLYLAGISDSLRYVNDFEFRETIESQLCKEVERPQLGDIVALRRTSERGRPLNHSLHSEVHAYTYVNEDIGFSKNGQGAKNLYEEQPHAEIYRNYKRASDIDCRIQGIPKKFCQLKTMYYRCQSLEGYLVDHPLESNRERDLLEKLKKKAQSVEAESFGLEVIEAFFPPHSSFSSELGDVLNARINSLESIF